MSRRSFLVKTSAHGLVDVRVGWDRPLQQFFLTAVKAEGGAFVYTNLDDPKSTPRGGLTLDLLFARLAKYEIPYPANLRTDLEDDARDNLICRDSYNAWPDVDVDETALTLTLLGEAAPFVSAVYGRCTVDMLGMIEVDAPETIESWKVPADACSVDVIASWCPAEHHEGRVAVEGYWDLRPVRFWVLPAPSAETLGEPS